MSEVELRRVYQTAREHSASDGELPPFSTQLVVEGITMQFTIDNSPGIHYTVGDLETTVYVDGSTGGQPVVSAETFVEEAKNIAAEMKEAFETSRQSNGSGAWITED